MIWPGPSRRVLELDGNLINLSADFAAPVILLWPSDVGASITRTSKEPLRLLGLLCPHHGPVLHLSSSTSGSMQVTGERFGLTSADLLSVSCSWADLGPNHNEQAFDETQLAWLPC